MTETTTVDQTPPARALEWVNALPILIGAFASYHAAPYIAARLSFDPPPLHIEKPIAPITIQPATPAVPESMIGKTTPATPASPVSPPNVAKPKPPVEPSQVAVIEQPAPAVAPVPLPIPIRPMIHQRQRIPAPVYHAYAPPPRVMLPMYRSPYGAYGRGIGFAHGFLGRFGIIHR